MPGRVDGVAYVHKKPIFVCSAGESDKNTGLQEGPSQKPHKLACWTCGTIFPSRNKLWSHLNGNADHQKFPPESADLPIWPRNTRLRVKFFLVEINGQTEIEPYVKEAIDEWKQVFSDTIMFEWVDRNAPADIRIRFSRGGPSWSALGPRAALCDRNLPTMTLALGGWEDKMMIWPIPTIQKAAAHLFGHALGLPCSKLQWPTRLDWSQVLGDQAADLVRKANASTADSSQSIMAFGSSGEGGSGYNGYSPGQVVLGDSLALMKKMYPPSLQAYHDIVRFSQCGGYPGGLSTGLGLRKQLYTTCTSNTISGVSHIDMHYDANFRFRAWKTSNNPGQNMEWEIGSWSNTKLYDASVSVLSFDQQDTRIQTGIEWTRDWKPNRESPDQPGATLTKRITFAKPFKKTPQVQSFISGLDVIAGNPNPRCRVWATDMDRNGFMLNAGGWADTVIFSLGVSWLAHEADEYGIRSGLLPSNQAYPNRVWELPIPKQAFSSPFPRKPRCLFRAIRTLDLLNNQCMRFDLQVDCDESGIWGSYKSWNTNTPGNSTAFYSLEGCYVAIL